MPTEQPQRESRVKKTLLNAKVNLIFYLLTLVLSFFSRKIFLDCLGADFVGLTGTLQNLLGFLNLAELGIGSAIGYVLYKPIFDRDHDSINEIISVLGFLYRWIGYIILAGGLILACFIPLIFSDQRTSFDLPIVYFVYVSFLGSSLIGYFINYRQNLLGADQRNYVVAGYFQTCNIIKTIVQMALAYATGSYYLWALIELIFGIIYSYILNWKINQTYPWLKTELKHGRKLLKKYPLIIKNTKRIFLHKIGIVTQWQAMPILIYAFASLKMVAYYENYTLMAGKILGMLNSVLGSTEAGVGNLIAEGNIQKVKNVLWEMMTLRYWVFGALFVALFFLLPPFIKLWLGAEYILPNIVLILVIANVGIQITQGGLGQFIYGFGLFNDVWATLAMAGIFLLGAVIGGHFGGLPGIIGASVLSLSLSYGVWKPYFLYHWGFKESFLHYLKEWTLIILQIGAIIFIQCIVTKMIRFINPYESFITLVEYAVIVLFIYLAISSIILRITNPYFIHIIKRFIRI